MDDEDNDPDLNFFNDQSKAVSLLYYAIDEFPSACFSYSFLEKFIFYLTNQH